MASPDRLCRHCELPLPDESSSWVREGFCCRGCKTVHGVLQAGGLDRYYALRDGAGVPVGELPDEHDLGWIEELRAAPSPRIEIDVQGMHCAGCVWVIEKLFERHALVDDILYGRDLSGRAVADAPEDSPRAHGRRNLFDASRADLSPVTWLADARRPPAMARHPEGSSVSDWSEIASGSVSMRLPR